MFRAVDGSLVTKARYVQIKIFSLFMNFLCNFKEGEFRPLKYDRRVAVGNRISIVDGVRSLKRFQYPLH